METRKIKKSFWIKLGLAPVLMFGFAYLMVPLYDVFCEITGLNGRTGRIELSQRYEVDKQRQVSVDFFASTMSGFAIDFKPSVRSMDVVPGEFYTATYIARNTTNETIVGQAIPSVAPTQAALHFKKLECFCFTHQEFKPGQEVEMGVRFVVDPAMSSDVKDISLSYNFFKVTS